MTEIFNQIVNLVSPVQEISPVPYQFRNKPSILTLFLSTSKLLHHLKVVTLFTELTSIVEAKIYPSTTERKTNS